MNSEKIEITCAEYDRLKSYSRMLGDIAAIVERYANRNHSLTTLQCVEKMDARVKKLNRRVKTLEKVILSGK